MTRITVALVATLAALTAAGAAASDTPAVRIQLFQFQPGALTVPPGTEVRWTNGDDIEHTVTAGVPDARTGRFDVRLATRGASASVRFTEPGVHPYFCDRHPSMRGEIRVNRPITSRRAS
jgi:plastocyanin